MAKIGESSKVNAKIKSDISILMLTPAWQMDYYGMSTITRSLINDLRLVDPVAHKISITCALLDKEPDDISKDISDAQKLNVELRGAKPPKHNSKAPSLRWLDDESITFYRHLVSERQYDFIVGHMPYIADGAFYLQEFSRERGHTPRVILVAHALPRTSRGDVDRVKLKEWLKDTHLLLSTGQGVEAEIAPFVNDIIESQKPQHIVYIPECEVELFDKKLKRSSKGLQGKQVITLMSSERKDLKVDGLDYELAMAAAVQAANSILELEASDSRRQIRLEFMIIAPTHNEKDEWEGAFREIRKRQPTKYKGIDLIIRVAENLEDLKSILKETAVFLLPLKQNSPLFGIDALRAASASTPILVSRNSGVASYLQHLNEPKSILDNFNDPERDAQFWKHAILNKLKFHQEIHDEVQNIRTKLIKDTSISASHLEFVQAVTGSLNTRIVVDMGPNCKVSPSGLETGSKFGVPVDQNSDASSFATAFLTKFLHQRKKIEYDLLSDQLSSSEKEALREFIVCLEQCMRKLVGLAPGSIVFVMFCPTVESYKQLREKSWVKNLKSKLGKLLTAIGIQGVDLDVHVRDTPTSTLKKNFVERVIVKWKQYKPSAQTEAVQTDSESDSRTVSSDSSAPMSPILKDEHLVERWLANKQSTPSDTSPLILIRKIDLKHLVGGQNSSLSFAIGPSGWVGILAFEGGFNKVGKLSWIQTSNDSYSMDEPSSGQYSGDPVFVNINGEEHMAVYNVTKNIHMWNLEKNAQRDVYSFKSKPTTPKPQNLCLLNDNIVACGDSYPSTEGNIKVYLLETGAKKWTIRNILHVTTEVRLITDMCFAKTTDGTLCLILSCPADGRVVAVDPVGGKILWQTGTKWVKFFPVGICAGSNNSLYVANPLQCKLFVISTDDGALIDTIHLGQFGIVCPVCVRTKGEYLYIAHIDAKNTNKWQISKFTTNEGPIVEISHL